MENGFLKYGWRHGDWEADQGLHGHRGKRLSWLEESGPQYRLALQGVSRRGLESQTEMTVW